MTGADTTLHFALCEMSEEDRWWVLLLAVRLVGKAKGKLKGKKTSWLTLIREHVDAEDAKEIAADLRGGRTPETVRLYHLGTAEGRRTRAEE